MSDLKTNKMSVTDLLYKFINTINDNCLHNLVNKEPFKRFFTVAGRTKDQVLEEFRILHKEVEKRLKEYESSVLRKEQYYDYGSNLKNLGGLTSEELLYMFAVLSSAGHFSLDWNDRTTSAYKTERIKEIRDELFKRTQPSFDEEEVRALVEKLKTAKKGPIHNLAVVSLREIFSKTC